MSASSCDVFYRTELRALFESESELLDDLKNGLNYHHVQSNETQETSPKFFSSSPDFYDFTFHSDLSQEKNRSLLNELEQDERSVQLAHPTRNAMPNDVRRNYAAMYMNCLNSGHLPEIESFFNIFMSNPCTYIINNRVSAAFGFPRLISGVGPRLYVHYLLGSYLMLPDLVISTKASRVVTTKGWKGTRIEIEFEGLATKVLELQGFAWVPPADQMTAMYYHNQRVVDTTQQEAPTAVCLRARPIENAQQLNTEHNTIPTAYIEAVLDRSVLAMPQLPLRWKGQTVLFLDENHFMQHVSVNLVQIYTSHVDM